MKKVLLILAEGFEEIEAVTPIDVLRRAGYEVTVASLNDSLEVSGSHDIRLKADTRLADYHGEPDLLVLPGGPGSEKLAASSQVLTWIERMRSAGRMVSAICAAPAVVLAPTGILEGKKATCFPGYEEKLGPKTVFSSERVVTDGMVITSRGAGTALEFSLELVRRLSGDEASRALAKRLLAP